MAAPAYVTLTVATKDTTFDASPETTAGVTVSTSGHTLVAAILHERANTTTPVVITSITRNGQSFTEGVTRDSGGGATNISGGLWVLPNADVGTYPLIITYTGSSGNDAMCIVLEYDGGILGASTDSEYYGSVNEAVAPIDLTAASADSRFVFMTGNFVGGAVWTSPTHGTSRHTDATATATAGDSLGIADYAPGSAGTVTGINYAFTPHAGSTSNWPNLTVGIELVPATSATEGVLSQSIGDITLAATGVGPGNASEGVVSASIGTITLVATGSGYQIPTVSRPAGGGDVDASATVVTDGYTATPTIELFGDPETNENISGGEKWEGFYAGVDLKQSGRTPVFKLDFSNWRQTTPPSNNALYWRYASDIGDMSAWVPFDNRSVAGSILTVSNSAAFTESAIQVANIPPVPYEELEDWLTTWDANANIFRPQACVDLAVSSSAPNKYAYYDFPDLLSTDGIQVGTTYAFAFGITNPAVTSPKKRLFHTWVHAGEWGGLRAMLRFAERLMSVSDADHDILRDEFEHIFMLTNTAGMVGGMARGAVESGDVGDDPNRAWGTNAIDRSDVTDTLLSVEASVDLIVTEWGVNGSDLVNCLGQIAWHSANSTSLKFGSYQDGLSTTESAFIGYVDALYVPTLHNFGTSSSGSSTAFSRTATVGAFGITFEWSYAFADFLNEIDDSVDVIAPALVDTFEAGYFGRTAQVDASIGAVTLSATGALDIAGTLSANIGTIGLSSAGKVAIAGTASASIGAISLSATGELALATGSGTLSQSIGEISLSAAGTLPIAGAVSASIGTIALVSTSKVAIAGALTASVGAVTLSAAGELAAEGTGTLSASIGEITAVASGRLALAAALSASIGSITLSAVGAEYVPSNRPPTRRRMNAGTWNRSIAA